MPAVEQRHRQKIDDPEFEAQHHGEKGNVGESLARLPPGHLRDHDRAAEGLAHRRAPGEQLAEPDEERLGHLPGFGDPPVTASRGGDRRLITSPRGVTPITHIGDLLPYTVFSATCFGITCTSSVMIDAPLSTGRRTSRSEE